MTKKMKLGAGFLLGAGLLAGCTMNGPSNLRVHQVDLSGSTNETLAWVYGNLGGASSSIKIAGTAADLRPQTSHPLALEGSLSVNGQPFYRAPLATSTPKLSVTRSAGSLSVQPLNGASLAAIYYTDAGQWYKLSGVNGAVSAVPTTGLRGAGQLTNAEADALSSVLSGQGRLAVAVLNDPAAPLNVEPQPAERLKTSLYVMPVADVTTTVTTSTTTVTPGTTSPSTPSTPGGTVNFTEVASGTSASANEPAALVASTDAEARSLYAVAYGRQSSRPTPPAVGSDTLIGVFAGQFNTGGYRVKVDSVQATGSTLTVRTSIVGPGPGMLTTQALTNPWVIVRVAGKFQNVSVLDAKGNTLR